MITGLRSGDPPSIGPYRLLGRLGAGGMGRVFLAMSPGRRLVAVKVIRPELAQEHGFRDRFAREITAAQRVNGMFTAPVVGSDAQAELPWMATAYVEGPSLAGAVDDNGPLPVSTVLTLAAGLAEALADIHRSGIVHRDLKPSNVLIASDGPRVIDFGISLAIEASMLSVAGTVLGSPGFMSPEQARGQHAVGKPADVFSLGAVLVFAATGIGPFGNGRKDALLYRVVNEEPNLAQVPGRLCPLIERCLTKDPASRPTPTEILEILADQDGAPTGEWLPQTVVDLIGRFSPVIETPTPALLIPELPEPLVSQAGPGTAPEAGRRRGRAEPAPGVRVDTSTAPGHRNGGDTHGSARSDGRRWRNWLWPVSAAAVIAVVAMLAAVLVPSRGGTPPTPTNSHTVASGTSVTSAPATEKTKNPARTPAALASTSYASEPLATGSSSITARVYFGQLKAVVSALAHRVTFNTPAAWVDQEPGKCALTVVFAGITNPKGAVYASGLDPGWRGLEYAPSQDTQNGRLHEQVVTPSGTMTAGQSWQLSAVLVAGNQRLTSDEYSLKFQGGAGAAQSWLIDGHAVSCHG